MSRHSREPVSNTALERVRREGRWWWLQARHARRIWRWALLAAVLLFVTLVLLRKPVANWLWNEPQIEQLLDQGDRALAAGRLSAADGSGARERYQAALALDGDRGEARHGLARTAQAALQQGTRAFQAGDIAGARSGLALARDLQVPERAADALARQLRQHDAERAGVPVLLGRAEAALQAQRLDDGEDSALPLFQRVLAVAPNQLRALEGREDALSDLLQRARDAAAAGNIAEAAAGVARAQVFDPGHVDLPGTREALNVAVAARQQAGALALRRQRWETAAGHFQAVLAAQPDDPGASQGLQRAVDAQMDHALRLAADFQFVQAGQALERAESMGASARALADARASVAQAQQTRQDQRTPPMPRAARERQLRALLADMADAEARGNFLAPPGRSAFDALREAQALAPDDPRVRAAAGRLLPASRTCFEDRLRENRVQAAGACLDAWQVLAPRDAAASVARRRLAQRWLAIGSERLGAGDLAFAERALDQARHWQPDVPELADFDQRLQAARGAR